MTCPVISILGDGENCDKFSLILSVKKVLEDKGYSVLVISGNPLARLFNCDVLPDFLYADDISLPLKVKRANSFICDLAEQKLPDIILISCPSGIMTLNDYEHNYFGEISYVLSNAIISDYGVLCIHYSKYYTDKYFDEMKKLCKLRLGVDIIKFYICNQTYNVNTEEEKVEYNFYSNKFCKENLPTEIVNSNIVLLPDDKKGIETFIDELTSLLNENPEII